MPTYEFSLLLGGIKDFDDQLIEDLFDVGCDDATLVSRNQLVYLDFSREASTIREALTSAIRQVEKPPNIKVARVLPDDYVTASEIARRIGKTREYVRLLIAGDRGGGGFPLFVVETGKSKLWSWQEVSFWVFTHGLIAAEEYSIAVCIEEVNIYLQQRKHLEDFTCEMKKLHNLIDDDKD